VGNTGLMNKHGLSESGEHTKRIAANDPPNKIAHLRIYMGVHGESQKRKKTLLTRPTSLEMTHYRRVLGIAAVRRLVIDLLVIDWLWLRFGF
jgi:hypothetical protein